MKAVGIKVLKDNLCKYLKMVAAGETVLVTDRDEVVAEIHSPTIATHPGVTRWEAFLNREERRRGLVRAETSAARPLHELTQFTRPTVKIDVQKLLSEIRTD